MKIAIPIFLGFILFLLPKECSSQDLHFTNNSITPSFFNPAQLGAYAGTFRAGIIYRDQYRIQSAAPYQQTSIFVDSPIIFGLTKQHWVGVGLTMFYDKAGSPGQTWNGLYPGVSYHIGLDKKFKNVFTIGVQYGFASRDYNDDGWISEDEELGTSSLSQDREFIENLQASYGDLNIGIMFKNRPDKFSRFELGASLMHVLNPSFNFAGAGGKNGIGRRINGHTKYRRATSRRMIWEPSIHASFMPSASNIQLQICNEYLLKKKGDFALITGLGYRLGDSFQVLTGAVYKDWIISLSYDYGLNEFGGSAFELGAQKLFIINKKPKVKPIIYCPRL